MLLKVASLEDDFQVSAATCADLTPQAKLAIQIVIDKIVTADTSNAQPYR